MRLTVKSHTTSNMRGNNDRLAFSNMTGAGEYLLYVPHDGLENSKYVESVLVGTLGVGHTADRGILGAFLSNEHVLSADIKLGRNGKVLRDSEGRLIISWKLVRLSNRQMEALKVELATGNQRTGRFMGATVANSTITTQSLSTLSVLSNSATSLLGVTDEDVKSLESFYVKLKSHTEECKDKGE